MRGICGAQTPIMQVLVEQSFPDWQGNAHLPYCVLQWCSPHTMSLWQGRASGPGTASPALPAGAGGAPG